MILSSFLEDSHTRADLAAGWRLVLPPADPMLGNAEEREIPARVPGCVHLDLMEAGLLADPFFADGEAKAQWVGWRDWTWRRTLQASELQSPRPGLRRQLVFEGLDTFAEVRLDGDLLATTDNMFHAHRIDLPDAVGGDRDHELEVTIRSPLATVDRIVEEKGPAPDSFGWHRGWARKAGYSYGWDWGPELPTSGVYRPVYFQCWFRGRIGWFRPEFRGDETRGTLAVRASSLLEQEGHWTLLGELAVDGKVSRVLSRDVTGAGPWEAALDFELNEPRLWWPAGEGEPHLYKLTLTLAHDGRPVHSVTEEIGLRTVEWVQEPDDWGRSFALRINGRDIFCRGANWIPGDSFLPRIQPGDLERSLGMARRAGMNMLRVWGGGLYEDPHFYRTCNRMGLMVWQDFMYACSLYPDDPAFRDNAQREARHVLADLLRHPCIVLWCGNNEIERDAKEFQRRFGTPYLGATLWHEQLPAVMAEMAPAAFYLPSSPFGGEYPNDPREGDRHVWSVWNGWGDPRLYSSEETRFASEFGFQAPATLPTWNEYLEPDQQRPQHEVYEAHNKQVDGPERIWRFLAASHHMPDTFEEMVHLAQDNQGRALTTALHHWRARRPGTMGTLIWQHNDCWPVTSWALVDWRDRPKPAWYRVRRAYASPAFALTLEGRRVHAVVLNDAPRSVKGVALLKVVDLEGRVLREEHVPFDLPGAGPAVLADLDPGKWVEDPRSQLLVLESRDDEAPARRRAVLALAPFKHMDLRPPEVEVDACARSGNPGVRIRARSLALGVWVDDTAVPDLMLEDNALDLLPGEELWLGTEHCRSGKPLKAVQPRVRAVGRVEGDDS